MARRWWSLGLAAAVAVNAAAQLGGVTARTGEESWEARSFQEDPANLKGERVGAVEEPDGLSERGRAVELEQSLRRLRTRASLMMIVAHPDDEDGGMLTYESRGQGARVGMLTLTRGEGGQNVMTGDFNDALGLVRTRELLAADHLMGIDQMFGTEVDFGFSKTKEEAFGQWGHPRVLYDAVRAVRLYRPLVLASVFVGAPSDGHGQHQVSGEMAQEVFKAAADPKVFPEMGLPVWAPMKVYGRVPFAQIDGRGMFDYATGKWVPVRFENYVTGNVSTVAPKADVMVPEGQDDALLGMSYVQWARRGLALQRTQIGAGMRMPSAGRMDVGYTRYGSRVPVSATEASFFDGVDVSLVGIAELAPSQAGALRPELVRIDGLVAKAQAGLGADGPESTAPVLRDGLVAVRGLIAHVERTSMPEAQRYDVLHELRVKEVEFQKALGFALGITMHTYVVTHVAVPGQTFTVQVKVGNESRDALRVRNETGRFTRGALIALQGGQGNVLGPNSVHEEALTVMVEPDALLTRPYFTRDGLEQPFYDVSDKPLRNAAVAPPALTAWETVWYGDVPILVGAVAEVAPGSVGEIAQPVQIVPPVGVAAAPKAGIVRPGHAEVPVHVTVRSNGSNAASGTVRLQGPKGSSEEPHAGQYDIHAGGTKQLDFTVRNTDESETMRKLTAVAEQGATAYREGYTQVGYPGIVRDNLYEPATVRVRKVDVRVAPGLRVAYLPGTGDGTVEALDNLGINAATVSVADIEAGRLADFDVLVLGVRVYAAQQSLATATPKLLAWVNTGGVAVLEYNTAEYRGSDAPYLIELGGAAEKVVDETDRVQLLDPAAQVLAWPNHITQTDFKGWIEERGHGFMTSWDPHYAAPTEVHDPEQDPQRGGLLVASYGKGVYVYCAYALYRQWPEGVPGSYRLLANLVSLGRRP